MAFSALLLLGLGGSVIGFLLSLLGAGGSILLLPHTGERRGPAHP